MATEAQRLIGISLAKIAQSRVHRGGVSLHKNLLVATVLQKARYIFMKEAYHMVHGGPYGLATHIQSHLYAPPVEIEEEDDSVLTSDENSPCDLARPTYLDLDKAAAQATKRRRAVTEWETEEAVLSILPKRTRQDLSDDESDNDSVFLDDEASLFSQSVSRDVEQEEQQQSSLDSPHTPPGMEIDRITSLVSIFGFGGKLARSVSTPDLCSAQALDPADSITQRPFIAMTV
uniref:Ier5 n=1 Tax=Xenopsylla cheopis TaxID=163159 RepID=A0A6M2DIQ7_XENCH